MSNAKVVMGQAANTLVKPLEVEDVFSTYLYEGNASTQTITNGIDLSGEGGLVWIKNRDYTYAHMLHDTEATGVENVLRLPNTGGISYDVDTLTSFNSDGFTIGADSEVNENGTGWTGHTSWTFRKAPKFFDVVTYAGTGSVQNISHNLGTTVGSILIKKTSNSSSWAVYHRGSNLGSSPEGYYLALDTTAAQNGSGSVWNNTAPTDTQFTVGTNTVANTSGETYVAYLFAHNDGDGGFNGGDIIKCGSFTTDSGGNFSVDLGYEPQWIMVKSIDFVDSWMLMDVMRGMSQTETKVLRPNTSGAESNYTQGYCTPTATGFTATTPGLFTGSKNFIYIAIRRGTKVPESATEVFDSDFARAAADGEKPEYRSGFPVDTRLTLYRDGGSSSYPAMGSRITGNEYLVTSSTAAGGAWTAQTFDYMNGFMNTAANSINTTLISHMWKRAPNFFDVVAYTGTGVARTVSHNLTVPPEMMWIKTRSDARNWIVYHKGIDVHSDNAPATDLIYLNLANVASDAGFNTFQNTEPTASVFSLGTASHVNHSGRTFIAYLFASLPGISKVGSYTGDGTTGRVIDCGFSSGARFVLIKPTSQTGGWSVYDTERGIVAGSDPVLYLNSTVAESSPEDDIDPHNSGFILNHKALGNFLNGSGVDYIFYAIA